MDKLIEAMLVGHNRSFDSDYIIYGALVEEWFKREADKRKYRDSRNG